MQTVLIKEQIGATTLISMIFHYSPRLESVSDLMSGSAASSYFTLEEIDIDNKKKKEQRNNNLNMACTEVKMN